MKVMKEFYIVIDNGNEYEYVAGPMCLTHAYDQLDELNEQFSKPLKIISKSSLVD